ncbi:nucleoside hydrolase [Sporolactobacillus sp. THM7-7]|nr:nucleoside hydrolase [Sporolactobacillus sp. THM7-7]
MSGKKKVILDVDTGVDDALGILLATHSEDLDILGITTVSGNVPLQMATRNTLKVLQLVGKENAISVYPGAYAPLIREPVYEYRVHGDDGMGGALSDMIVTAEPAKQRAAAFIVDQVNRYPNEVTLIMTAPLTNLAEAMRLDPLLNQKVGRIVSMGGAVKEARGNITPEAEFNIYADPEAARKVYHSGMKLTMVGLDVTEKALLREKDIDRLKGTAYYDFVQTVTRDYLAFSERGTGVRACAMHDPLAVAVAVRSDLVRTEKHYVDVETSSTLCDGQTVCDFKGRFGKKPNVDVALEVDAGRFIELFLSTLRKSETTRL